MSFTYTLTDGTKVTLPKERLSYSQISMYLKCPAQYEQHYVLGRSSPPGIALVEGTCAHAALEENNLNKIARGDDLPAKQVVEVFADTLSDKGKEVEDWEGDSADIVIDRAKQYLGAYMAGYAPLLRPVSAEQEYLFDVAGVPMVAVIDVQTAGAVLDYKTVTSRSQVFQAPAKSLQLNLYGRIANKDKAGYIGLLKDKGDFKTADALLDRNRMTIVVEQTVTRVAKAISAGIFPMVDEGSWACSPTFCGFFRNCRGAMLHGSWPKPAPADVSMGTVLAPKKAPARKIKAV